MSGQLTAENSNSGKSHKCFEVTPTVQAMQPLGLQQTTHAITL